MRLTLSWYLDKLCSQTQNGVEVTVKLNHYGHYLVSGTVNHNDATFILDTGATLAKYP
ncbi:hypothetical protein [Aliikangiella coralliicola]|uniref:hypothetical protein n=1 Tax=Aliikangiella coralliicola TaxID=2592383 RepID=UPI00143D4BE9|nr:hypothetical protein [Aliikangiella coralliicola]